MLASDAQNPEFQGAHNPDAALVVRFHTRAIEQPYLSNQENRKIFRDQDFIQIFTPGNQLNIIDTPVREEHKRRFPIQWAAFQNTKAGGAGAEVGTPVSEWPFLSRSQAEELKALKFFTVEQIFNASDLQLQSMSMVAGANPHVIRARAGAFLAAASGSAESSLHAAELAQTKEQLAALQAQVTALLSGQPQAAPAAKKTKAAAKPRSEAQLANDERLRQKHAAKRQQEAT